MIIYTIDYTVYYNPNTKVQYKVCIIFVYYTQSYTLYTFKLSRKLTVNMIIYTIDYTVYYNLNTKVQYKVCIIFVYYTQYTHYTLSNFHERLRRDYKNDYHIVGSLYTLYFIH